MAKDHQCKELLAPRSNMSLDDLTLENFQLQLGQPSMVNEPVLAKHAGLLSSYDIHDTDETDDDDVCRESYASDTSLGPPQTYPGSESAIAESQRLEESEEPVEPQPTTQSQVSCIVGALESTGCLELPTETLADRIYEMNDCSGTCAEMNQRTLGRFNYKLR